MPAELYHPSPSTVDYLLISTAHAPVAARLRDQLASSGIRTRESALGLEVWCHQPDWRPLLRTIAALLSPAQRQDTRIATIRLSHDSADLPRAIFRARTVEVLLRDLDRTWLDQLLDEDRLTIHFQPLVQYPPGRVHGYECLARGIDPDGRLISPARLFEAADTSHKRQMLDERCRLAALRAAARLAEPRLMFFINFIPSAIGDPRRCVAEMCGAIAGTSLRPAQIAFEVVETDKIADRRQLTRILRVFRQTGFKVALDDVGAGYSSLLNICCLRPDYIKLDGELVRRAGRSALEAKLVRDLAATAGANGIVTVAEGIEGETELAMAMRAGIGLTQGYYHARPAPRILQSLRLRSVRTRLERVAARNLALAG